MWWQDLLYGPAVQRMDDGRLPAGPNVQHVDDGRILVRSCTFEYEDVYAILAFVEERIHQVEAFDSGPAQRAHLLSLVPDSSVQGGRDLSIQAPLSDLTDLQLRHFVIRDSRQQLTVRLDASAPPTLHFGLDHEQCAVDIAHFMMRLGRPRIWWQRWTRAIPVALVVTMTVVWAWFVIATQPAWQLSVFGLLGTIVAAVYAANYLRERARFGSIRCPGHLVRSQPREALRATRANRRENLKVGVPTAIIAAAVGAVLGQVVRILTS